MRGVIGPGPTPVTIRHHPAKVSLVPVTNRGSVFDPPISHLGKLLADQTVVTIAEHALEYVKGLMTDAEEKFGQ